MTIQMPKFPTLDELATTARTLMLNDGHHVTTLLLATNKTMLPVGIPMIDGDRQAYMHVIGQQIRQQHNLGRLQRVCFISEVWMATAAANESPAHVRPSEHPNRIEALIVLEYHVPKKKTSMRIFEIVRDDNGTVVDTQAVETDGAEVAAYLIEAFLAGYQPKRALRT